MVIFGGFLEITKELSDLIIFDIPTSTWIKIFEDINSPHIQKSVIKNVQQNSAYKR